MALAHRQRSFPRLQVALLGALVLALSACGAAPAASTASAAGSASASAAPSSTTAATSTATMTASTAVASTSATRTSGTIQSVANNQVTLSDGTHFALTSSTLISRAMAATLSDLKPGDFVAVTATRQPDNTLLATVVNVFPASAKGARRGQFPMSGGNLMTNATISKVTGTGFTVMFPGGGANITLASGAKVTRSVTADASALTPGTKISAAVRDGTAQSIAVQ